MEDFERGLGNAKPYHRDGSVAQVEIATDGSASDGQFLRAVLPGQRALEGVSMTATVPSGGRVANVTAQVRGKGQIWLCLISSNGWLYSPKTMQLNDRWQTISLRKSLMVRDRTLGIHFLAKTAQPDAVFEVDDVRVTLDDPPKVYDAAVGPWRFEAEDFAQRLANVSADESASGGRSASSTQYWRLKQIPFPRTSRPVTVYVRVKPASEQETYRLLTTQGGLTQVLSVISPAQRGRWQWIRFPTAYAGEAGNHFDVDVRPAKGTVDPDAIDSVVLATRDDLAGDLLDAAPAPLTQLPMTLVARTDSPPKLDGQPADACWSNTIACTDFLQVGSFAPARAATTVRLCYDDRCLYALFVCEEPILSVAGQQRHEFAAAVKEHDGDVHRDDSVVMLLDPTQAGKQVFELAINSLGTIADAQCPGPDLWASRDVAWNSSAAAAGATGDGKWCVEIALPFSGLGLEPPTVGDMWLACLGRTARARRESASWNLSNRGFHDPRSMGRLMFAGPALGVTLESPRSLQLGKNVVTATVSPLDDQPVGVYVMSSTKTRDETRHSVQFTEVQKTGTQVTAPFMVESEAELQVAHGVLDAATLRPLCLTPPRLQTVKSALATVTLTCDGPFELLLNDQLLQRGQRADKVAIKAPLQAGANVFALRLQNGTATAQIAAPGLETQSVNWKIAPADQAGVTSPATDDSGWKTAPKVDELPVVHRVPLATRQCSPDTALKSGESPAKDSPQGQPGRPVVLRHTLLWEKTRIWPTPKPALHIARNSAQHLTVIADGLPHRKLLDWSVYLAVPMHFEILGSTGYYGNVDYQPSFSCTQLGIQSVDGRKMRVARISADKPVMAGRHYIFSLFNVFVRTAAETHATDDETAFVYWTEANDGTVVEPRQTIPVRVLPPLNGRQPKRLVTQLWGSFFGNMNNLAMREAALETMQQAGVNDIVAGDLWSSRNAPRFGIEHTMGINFQSWSLNLEPYLQEHPEQRLIGSDGHPQDGHLCTSLLLAGSWHAVEARLRDKIESIRANTLDYDYEYSPFSGPHSCYCPRCLTAFREYARLKPDEELDANAIRDRHEEQWVDFMARRVAQIFRQFKETIHRLSPGTRFSVYSGYQTPENPKRYGVNWDYIGELQACDRAGCGYGRPVDAIDRTIAGLQGIPAVFGELMRPYATKEVVPLSPLSTARLLRRALDSTGGVLVFNRLPMDGRSWHAVAAMTRLVATHEDLFLAGRRAGLPGCEGPQVQVLSGGKHTLVCAMNEGGSSLDLRLTLPEEAGGGSEFYTGQRVAAGQTVDCTLPAGEVAVYVLSR